MTFSPRPLAFVLSASHHGPMIVNRNDFNKGKKNYYGVGYQILNNACFDPDEVSLALTILSCRRKYFGDGVFAIDGGANIGVHTLEWARHMHGWGCVLSFEAQERIFYALAGNVVLNNCTNAQVKLSALGREPGIMYIPQPDYNLQGSFGSLELNKSERNEFIGQDISYQKEDCNVIPVTALDSLPIPRLDFMKLDVEGMEMDVLFGAIQQIQTHHPIIMIEVLKSDNNEIYEFLTQMGYQIFPCGINALAIHNSDPTLNDVR